MYLISALVVLFTSVLVLINGYVFNRGIKKSYKLTLSDIEEFRGKEMYYSKVKGLFEIFSIILISVLILLFAFQESLNSDQEMIFMLIGVSVFCLSFIRSLFVLNVKVRFTDEYIYITKYLSEKKYRIDEITYIDHASMHLIFRTPENWFMCFIPVGINNIDIIYKLLLNQVEEINNDIDRYDYK